MILLYIEKNTKKNKNKKITCVCQLQSLTIIYDTNQVLLSYMSLSFYLLGKAKFAVIGH